MPKVSVIVTSFNSEKTIEKTIQNIIGQTFDGFELILVDRNSKDKTLEIAGKYKGHINKWLSEPCKGLYDALNKGVLLSQGEYILFLNSGDTLYSDKTLEIFSQYLNEEDIVYSDISIVSENTKTTVTYKPKYNKKYALIEGETFLETEFIKREFLEKTGGFDNRFMILGNKEFNLRAVLREKAALKYINDTAVVMTKSKNDILSPKSARRYQKEKAALRKLYFSKWETILNKFLFLFFG